MFYSTVSRSCNWTIWCLVCVVLNIGKWYFCVFVDCPRSTNHKGERVNIAWLGIRIMCPSRAACLHADWCFSELALKTVCWSGTKWTSSSSHRFNLFSPCDITDKLLLWHYITITHPLAHSNKDQRCITIKLLCPLFHINLFITLTKFTMYLHITVHL